MTRNKYRLIVCVDVEASSMLEAYKRVRAALNTVKAQNGCDGDDGCYTVAGELISPNKLQRVIVGALKEPTQ